MIVLATTLSLAQTAQAPAKNMIAVVDSGKPFSHTSLKLDASGKPVISYIDGADLKVAHCGNLTCTSGNSIVTGDRKRVEAQTSLAVNLSGNPVVAYYFGDAGVGKSKLKMLFCQDPNCQANTTIMTGASGQSGISPSLVLDVLGNPVVSYESLGVSSLLVQHCGDATCSTNNVDTPVGGLFPYTGGLTLDSAGNPVIVGAFNLQLALEHCGDPDCISGNSLVTNLADLGGLGGFGQMSLALDVAGNPVISYLNQESGGNNLGTLHVVHCGDPNCASGNLDTPVDAMASNQTTSSLAQDASGHPVVSYGQNNSSLAILHCGDANCTNGNTTAIPDTDGDWSSLALDTMGRPVVSYTNSANQMKVLHCATTTCQ